ncbi:MAG: hypothetical protein J6Z30_06190 [Pyramidobacter sp.]|nr:hypothetical protein [Pyramidobacter sp.]
MKMSRKVFAALALVLAFCAAAWAFPNEPTGFNGIAWGSRWEGMASQFRESRRPPMNGNYYYEKNFSHAQWIGYRLNTMEYIFRDDSRFWGIEGRVSDRSSRYEDVVYTASGQWGEPRYGVDDRNRRTATWFGHRVVIVITETDRGWKFSSTWRGPNVPPPPPPSGPRPGYGPPPPPPPAPAPHPGPKPGPYPPAPHPGPKPGPHHPAPHPGPKPPAHHW